MNTRVLDKKVTIAGLFELFAYLYKYPNEEIWSNISSNHLLDDLKEYSQQFHGKSGLITFENQPESLKQMRNEYYESLGSKAIPIESVYKKWTADPTCTLPFAHSKGYLMGDSALHVRFLLEQLKINIEDEYRSCPDHLSILLELLALFIKHSDKRFVVQFLNDHFDWIDDFAQKLQPLPESNFYVQMTCLLQQMLSDLKALYET